MLLQFDYSNWLGAQCGCEGFEEWRIQKYYASGIGRRLRPDTYRDHEEEDDHHLVLEIHQIK